ncbi:MAG TPA: aldehyde dehydrogenase family protein, partial [Gemmatimonadota bacterium]|nr:aldehyde dehydrogenase family protein [Gemmatimonadota bacterium]
MSDPAIESQRAAPVHSRAAGPDARRPSTLTERLKDYRPEAYPDFSDPEVRQRMEVAIDRVRSRLGRTYPNRVGGEDLHLPETQSSTNPASPQQVIGVFPRGHQKMADRAMEAADGAFQRWKDVPADERSAVLFRTADIMRRRRLELAAWMVFEVGKSWAEADADVAEAIDFCDYYARLMLHYAYDPYPLAEYP